MLSLFHIIYIHVYDPLNPMALTYFFFLCYSAMALVSFWSSRTLNNCLYQQINESEQSLYELKLVPAVMFNFEWDLSVQDPNLDDSVYLKPDTLMLLQDSEQWGCAERSRVKDYFWDRSLSIAQDHNDKKDGSLKALY